MCFGEVSWEINEEGKPIFAGTWRAGDPDGDGVAEPGLLMPGTFTIGGRYIFDGSQSTAYGGSENMEAGIEITVPAGTFKGCVRVREQGLLDLSDITDKVWCPVVGVVLDTSDGKLVVSNALPTDNPASDVSSVGIALRDKPLKVYAAPWRRSRRSRRRRSRFSLNPGQSHLVKIERKLGKKSTWSRSSHERRATASRVTVSSVRAMRRGTWSLFTGTMTIRGRNAELDVVLYSERIPP